MLYIQLHVRDSGMGSTVFFCYLRIFIEHLQHSTVWDFIGKVEDSSH